MGELKSIIIKIENISFFKNSLSGIISTYTSDQEATSIQILFEIPKNLHVNKPVLNYKSNSDLYPIYTW